MSCDGPAFVWWDGAAEPWKAAWKLERAAQDQEWRRRWREFWWRSASFLFLKRLLQYWHEYCFSISWALFGVSVWYSVLIVQKW